MMDKIKRPISADPIMGNPRSGELESFVILANLEMIQQVRVSILDAENVPLKEKILNDETLTAEQLATYLAQYADRIVTRQTEGCYLNAQGQVVPADQAGAVKQSQYLQGITLGMLKAQGLPIHDDMPVLQIIYAMLASEIGNIDARGGL